MRYFIGNRADMTELLIKRITARAEQVMSDIRPKGRSVEIDDQIDILFDGAFADETVNQIIRELWTLAERDDVVRLRLTKIYDNVRALLIDQLRIDDIGQDETQRRGAAMAIMSMAYGEATFAHLYQNETRRRTVKQFAKLMVATLAIETKHEAETRR